VRPPAKSSPARCSISRAPGPMVIAHRLPATAGRHRAAPHRHFSGPHPRLDRTWRVLARRRCRTWPDRSSTLSAQHLQRSKCINRAVALPERRGARKQGCVQTAAVRLGRALISDTVKLISRCACIAHSHHASNLCMRPSRDELQLHGETGSPCSAISNRRR
jgi:hypothetical protein